MDVGLCDVEILPSTDDMVRVDATNCWFGSDMSLVVKEDEGKLKIKTSRKRQILDVLSLIADDDVSGDLKIYLPADLRLDTAKLTFGASDVEIQALSADEVILKVGAADCSIKCMNVGTMRTDVGAGSVEMEGIIQGDLNVKCGAGDVEACLQAKESDYNYSIKSGAGDISIGGRDYNGLASVRNIDNGSEQDIEIICGAGEVEIEFEQRTYEDGHHDLSLIHI